MKNAVFLKSFLFCCGMILFTQGSRAQTVAPPKNPAPAPKQAPAAKADSVQTTGKDDRTYVVPAAKTYGTPGSSATPKQVSNRPVKAAAVSARPRQKAEISN
jgi:hypothetical protein